MCIALISLVAVLLAACGGDDESSSSSGSTSGSTSSSGSTSNGSKKLSGEPLRVGLICGCSGPTAGTSGGLPTIAQAWTDYINDNGGINGHPVKVFIGDDKTNPATSRTVVKKLIQEDKVQTLVSGSYVEGVWGPDAVKGGVPVTGGNSTQPGFTQFPLFFPSSGGFAASLYGVMALTDKSGEKKLGVVSQAGLPVGQVLVGALTIAAKDFGSQVVAAGAVSATQPDFAATCISMKNSGADAAFVALSSDIVVRLVKQCAQQGYTPQQINVSNVVSNNFLDSPAMDGMISAQNNAPLGDTSTDGQKTFNDAMKKYASDLTDTTQYGEVAINAWSGFELFKAAAEAGDLSPDSPPSATVDGLYKLKDETLGGLAPPLTFAKGKTTNNPCYFRQDIKDGKYVAPDGAKPTCVPQEVADRIAAALSGG